MKYGIIVENPFEFEVGKYYCVISDCKILDSFICNNLDACARHYQTYVVERKCELWRYIPTEDVPKVVENIRSERSSVYQLFANGKRRASSNLKKCCEMATMENRIRKIFC